MAQTAFANKPEGLPADPVYAAQLGTGMQRWNTHPSIMDDLKVKAKKLGLWNMFLPVAHFKEGAGFSNLEYGLMAEWLGKSRTASEVCWVQSYHAFRMLLTLLIGLQLRCSRHWKYGSPCQIR